jgi:hypothetical protein
MIKGNLAQMISLRDTFTAKYPNCLEAHEFLAAKYQESRDYEKPFPSIKKFLKLIPITPMLIT